LLCDYARRQAGIANPLRPAVAEKSLSLVDVAITAQE
jgi:hypothetical protein